MTTTTTVEPTHWTIAEKLAFRFFMLFFILYIILEPNGVIPGYQGIYGAFIELYHHLVPWIGKHILHLAKPITVFTNGSGDTTFDYIMVLLVTIKAFVGMIIWSALDWKRPHYNKLLYWSTVIIRYYVAITMITYGCVKIIKLQFPYPSPGRLLQPLGSFSPMGLEWTYMGFSRGLNYVTGIAEFSCGLLLFFRRTTTLGAILGLVVAGNIMAVNYCYDVPVKILSTMLVAMFLYLLVKDAPRLINFFLLNKEAKPADLSDHKFKARWKNIVLIVIKYALVAYITLGYLYGDYQSSQYYGDGAKKTPLYGIYNVLSFVRNNDTLKPLTTDTIRWSKLIVNNYTNNAQIRLMNDSTKYYSFKPDTVKHTIIINSFADTAHKYHFSYTTPKPDQLLLTGRWKQDSVRIMFKRFDPKDFPLFKRGFHWVNEYPYNR